MKNHTCANDGKHKYVTDEESGEIVCLKCGNVEKLESNILEYKDRPEAEDGKKFDRHAKTSGQKYRDKKREDVLLELKKHSRNYFYEENSS